MRAPRRQERPLFSRKTPTATAKALTLCEAHEVVGKLVVGLELTVRLGGVAPSVFCATG
jgi:hypothetical protein